MDAGFASRTRRAGLRPARSTKSKGWVMRWLPAVSAFAVGCEDSPQKGVVGPDAGSAPSAAVALAGAATKLAFSVQPSKASAGATISPAVVVTALDAAGRRSTAFSGSVTLAISTNPSGGTLAGTTTVSAVSGKATFSNLSINKAGTGYRLVATSGALTTATSAAFTITPGPAKQLAFTVQPTTTAAGATISPAIQVTAQDALGNAVPGFKGSVTVAIGTNPAGGTLAGTKTVSAVVGVAVFSSLSIDKGGAGYTLTATSGTLTAATSAAFDVTNFWTLHASMPTPRNYPGVAAINGILYAVGGVGAGNLATLEAYHPLTDTWTTQAPMPTARQGAGVAALNGILYVVGGFDNAGNYLTTVEAYDPATNTWTTRAPMPTARTDLAVAAFNGILYAVGGFQFSSGYLATVEAYDPATDTWTTKTSMPTARYGLGATVINGIVYAVGGGGNGSPATVEAYDPATDAWTTKAPLPTARHHPGVGAINGILFAVSGLDPNNSARLATVEAYNPATNTWTTKAPIPTVPGGPGVAAINGILYAVGGFDNNGYLATLSAYHP